MGWKIEFISGGLESYTKEELIQILKELICPDKENIEVKSPWPDNKKAAFIITHDVEPTKFSYKEGKADMVIGTRTTRQLIQQGSNMRGLVRIANIILAKLLELLWWRFECRFTDVGCTFRVMWRTTFEKIKPRLTGTGVELSPELTIEMLNLFMIYIF